jgi:excinuclease UvrABC nuclease subunit
MNSGIYKITHRETGRVYIGQSIKLKRRYNGYKNAGGNLNSVGWSAIRLI